MKPILFLDLSGVLNNVRFFREHKLLGTPGKFDPECVKQLQHIVEQTHCDIVVTSTWRRIYSLSELALFLNHCGYQGDPPFIGATPRLHFTGTRGEEVDEYLRTRPFYELRNANQEIICCVDDRGDYEFHHNLVRINDEFGLTALDAESIIDALTLAKGQNARAW